MQRISTYASSILACLTESGRPMVAGVVVHGFDLAADARGDESPAPRYDRDALRAYWMAPATDRQSTPSSSAPGWRRSTESTAS